MAQDFGLENLKTGLVEVVVGCMFSGKTEALIKRMRRAQLAKKKVQIFKPHIDSRYSAGDIASHDYNYLPAIPVQEAHEILLKLNPDTQVVGIDEGQFFDHQLVTVAANLADQGRRVVVAGLDTDWRGRPFGPMPHLMAIAEIIHKQYAICNQCGAPATRTQRLVPAQEDILVGSSESYEPRCRHHFDPDFTGQTLTETPHELTLSEL